MSGTSPDSVTYPEQYYGVLAVQEGSLFADVNHDWLEDQAGLSWLRTTSTFYVVNPVGQVGFTAASRASDVPSNLGTSQISIPFVGIAVMDRSGSGPPYWTSYGAYLEARMEPVSSAIGTVIGLEIDGINFGSIQSEPTPWRAQTLGGTTGIWLASGGDPANHGRTIFPAQLALGIVNNGQTWQAGIVIRHDAIEGTDGTTGFGAAINLSTRHILGWYGEGGGNGERVNFITSTNTVPGHSLQFQDAGTLFLSAGGSVDLSIGNVGSSVNGVGIIPAITGGSPYIETFGSDAAPNLDIKPKGAGNLRLFADNLLFMADDGNQLAYVQSQVSANTYEQGLIFADGGPFFYGRGNVIAGFGMVASGVNHISLSNAASGTPAVIKAEGPETNIDILIDPAGTDGTIWFAVPTASSATAGGASALPGNPTTYLIIRDAAGTPIKIPAWNM